MANESKPLKKIQRTGYDPELVWDLDTEQVVEGRTWWWWWWIFFIRDPKHPGRTRQLMVLHSTKEADEVRVMDHTWRRRYPLYRKQAERPEGGVDRELHFHGMSAAWYYDGETMHEPFLLQDLEFVSSYGPDGKGRLVPAGRPDLEMEGDGSRYTVKVADTEGKTSMVFELSPWSPWLSEHRYTKSNIWRHWGYDILKIHGARMRGEIRAEGSAVERVEGTAYFQKVRVNAPSTPWYWVVLHGDAGWYLDYFQPNVGVQMWRRTARQRSIVDRWSWGEKKLRNNLEVYDPRTQTMHTLKDFRLRHTYDGAGELPVFRAEAEGETARVKIELRTYARTYWRFQQSHLGGLLKSILFYNEYPAELTAFEFEDKSTGLTASREDLGFVAANCEHAWGKLY